MITYVLCSSPKKIHKGSHKTYGSPRIHAVLGGLGEECSQNRVVRLMQRHGIRAKTKKKFKGTPNSKHNMPVAPNLLKRDFTPNSPNKAWAGDIIYVWTREGWVVSGSCPRSFFTQSRGMVDGLYPKQRFGRSCPQNGDESPSTRGWLGLSLR